MRILWLRGRTEKGERLVALAPLCFFTQGVREEDLEELLVATKYQEKVKYLVEDELRKRGKAIKVKETSCSLPLRSEGRGLEFDMGRASEKEWEDLTKAMAAVVGEEKIPWANMARIGAERDAVLEWATMTKRAATKREAEKLAEALAEDASPDARILRKARI